jgi:3'(2'), 5'-bisphosphate nucleotidase
MTNGFTLTIPDIEAINHTLREAGEEVMRIYSDPVTANHVDYKSDGSPLTLADKASHNTIVTFLQERFPTIPVLSEEASIEVLLEERLGWEHFWMLDPLDGTKEFVKRNGEFTINLALIEGGFPTAGFIYAPDKKVTYFAVEQSAHKIEQEVTTTLSLPHKTDGPKVAVQSRNHSAPEETDYYNKLGIAENTSMGSAFKFTLIAEGRADIYYRHNPTMEWDTAAGQAILEAAGGEVTDVSGKRFAYNKHSLVNTSFIARGNFAFPTF